MLSTPNGRRLERALPGLDLVVCFDYYLTETARHADYILPPASPLETSEYDVALSFLAVRNVAHFSAPMFDPPEGVRHDWQARAGLTARLHANRGARGRAVGLALATVVERLGAEGLLDVMIRSGPYGHGASLVRASERPSVRASERPSVRASERPSARWAPLRSPEPDGGASRRSPRRARSERRSHTQARTDPRASALPG